MPKNKTQDGGHRHFDFCQTCDFPLMAVSIGVPNLVELSSLATEIWPKGQI